MSGNDENIFAGPRIRICALEKEDAQAFARWSEDAEYTRNLDTDCAAPRSADFFRAEMESRASAKDGWEFGIRAMEGNKLIGFIALHSIEWNNRAGIMSIGIGEPGYRGGGYGTEAVRLILRYAFCELNLNRVGLDVISGNEAAIRCYEKAGFRREGAAREAVQRDGRKCDRIYMGILFDEWARAQGG